MQIYFYDDDGFLTDTAIVDDTKGLINFTEIAPENGFFKPKFDGEKWVEGEIPMKIIMGDKKHDTLKFSNPYIIMKFISLLMKGGEDMQKDNWYFEYCMYYWYSGEIDENYLDMAKELGLLTASQVHIIKVSPREKRG